MNALSWTLRCQTVDRSNFAIEGYLTEADVMGVLRDNFLGSSNSSLTTTAAPQNYHSALDTPLPLFPIAKAPRALYTHSHTLLYLEAQEH
jgi:hypothetical protein